MNIVYNASAGTGKTHQVTELYERLVLQEGVDPRDILLMTFTENAAEELRGRVAQRLLKVRHAAEQADDYGLAERTIHAMAHLPSAPIGTIHSYCTRLLREHALDAGLSPSFSILDDEATQELFDQICRETLLKHLKTDAEFKTFCSGYRAIGDGKGFGSSVTESVARLVGEAGSLGIDLGRAASMLPDPEAPIPIDEFKGVLRDLKSVAKPSKKINEAIGAMEDCLNQTNDPLEFVRLFDRSFKGHFSYGEAKTIYPRFKEVKEQAIARERYRERHASAKAYARYVQSVAVRFRDRKHELDAVDFDDLVAKAVSLLKTGRARTSFAHIIVDEVQDTSRIQCELVRLLWQSGGYLVICGDKKQSIYTWRGADPQVMPDLERAILEAGGELRNLQTSWRSKKPIIETVNALFANVYGEEDYAEGDRLEPNPAFDVAEEKTCVEFLQPEEQEDLTRPEKTASEMEAVANRIQLLVNGTGDWKPAFRYSDGFKSVDGSNAYRYSDILILLRRTTYQPALEAALRHAGIPYTLGGKGSGLFTRQETRDVSLFLNAVTNPKDVYSLVGFLRSPWVGLSDEEIAGSAFKEDRFSVEHLCSKEPEILERYRALLGTKLASELVRMLIEETGYDALLVGLPRGEQRLANLRKVIDWLRETERGARITPAAVARKLAEHIAYPPKVSDAALMDPAQNAVTIMTVHGAKGLTKRVVFLPDTCAKDKNDTDSAHVYLNENGHPELGLKITAPDKTDVESPGFSDAKKRANEIRKREQQNLLYVAMTRARDLVVASASVGSRTTGWYQQLEPMIGNGIDPIPYDALAQAVEHRDVVSRIHPTSAQLAGALQQLPYFPIKPALQRIPATQLAKEQDELEPEDIATGNRAPDNARALGTLGHAVLEQLALNRWQGSARQWLEILHDGFGLTKTEALGLETRIEQTRELMAETTAGTTGLHPEFPFVLRDGAMLIDGTIDLLCGTSNGYAVFDYKFTESNDEQLTADYRKQMEIYSKAACRRYPDAMETQCHLIVVSSKGPRLLPIEIQARIA